MITNKKVLIIAEAGVNHNGDINLAIKLIDAAVDANVDIVKFQTFIAENVISKHAQKADYQKESTGGNESQLDMVKKLQLSFNDFIELKKYSEKKGIVFLSTPFDLESVDFLKSLNMGLWKIPSGEITNLPYLRKIGAYNEKVIFSTGMSTLGDIENAIDVIVKAGTLKNNITVLHCNTEYPTPMKDVNLKAMLTIKNAFHVNVGYSDHTLGIEIPIAAVALGATVIRNIELALGTGTKLPSESEQKNTEIARKSLHLAYDLKSGHVLSENDLTVKRPGNGINPMLINEIIGCKLKADVVKDSILHLKDIEWK
jgi:N,N'-diacetyllegionaminate synthase